VRGAEREDRAQISCPDCGSAVIVHGIDGRILGASEEFCAQEGKSEAQLVALPAWGWVHELDRGRIQQLVSVILTHGHCAFEITPPTAATSPGPWRIEATLVHMAGMPAIVSIRRDLGALRPEGRIASLEAMLLDHVSDAVICHTLAGRIVYVNEAAAAQYGYARDALLGLSLTDIVSESYRGEIERQSQQLLDEGGGIFESEDLTSDGRRIPVEVHARIVELDGEPLVLSIIRDISERKRSQREIELLAYYDALTGLPNRRTVMERLTQALAQARRTGQTVALAFIDLDYLKRINDRLGHRAGDELIRLVGERLRSVTRAEDTVARIGGDEFVALFVGLPNPAAVDALAEKVVAAMREPFHVAGMRVFATASMGVALNEPPTISEVDLLGNADAAMYAVKMTMRNSWALFSPEMHTAAMAEYDVAGEMKAALQSGQMVVHYQPQVELETGRVLAVEALVRWNHPTRGLLEAVEFMTRAEESGLVIPLGELVLQAACRQHRQWESEGLGKIRIAVNVSHQELSQPTYVDVVRSIITDAGVDPGYIELEVSELDIIRADSAMRRTFDRLHHAGLRLAVDDFGRGYASLGHLHDFPIDTLKIDRSHTSRVGDPMHDALAAASLVLATGLAVDTVAECAETAEQLEALRSGPYHAVQGYVFGHAAPPGDLEEVLRNGCQVPAEDESSGEGDDASA